MKRWVCLQRSARREVPVETQDSGDIVVGSGRVELGSGTRGQPGSTHLFQALGIACLRMRSQPPMMVSKCDS